MLKTVFRRAGWQVFGGLVVDIATIPYGVEGTHRLLEEPRQFVLGGGGLRRLTRNWRDTSTSTRLWRLTHNFGELIRRCISYFWRGPSSTYEGFNEFFRAFSNLFEVIRPPSSPRERLRTRYDDGEMHRHRCTVGPENVNECLVPQG